MTLSFDLNNSVAFTEIKKMRRRTDLKEIKKKKNNW